MYPPPLAPLAISQPLRGMWYYVTEIGVSNGRNMREDAMRRSYRLSVWLSHEQSCIQTIVWCLLPCIGVQGITSGPTRPAHPMIKARAMRWNSSSKRHLPPWCVLTRLLVLYHYVITTFVINTVANRCGWQAATTRCLKTSGRILTHCQATPSGAEAESTCVVQHTPVVPQGEKRRRTQHHLCGIVHVCQPWRLANLRPQHQLL